MAPAPRLTTDAYLRTPETLRPSELIYGALRVADAPTVRHQQAVGAFLFHLMAHARERRIGTVLTSPIDVIFDYTRDLILQPDLLFVSKERQGILGDQVNGAPDMVLEVLSPHPRIGELNERLTWFAEYGVREIWLLHQVDERLVILTTDKGRIVAQQTFDYLTPLRSAVLPHFSYTVAELLHE